MNNKDEDLKLIRRHTSNIINLQRTTTNSISLIVILTRIEVACNKCQQRSKQNTDGEVQIVKECMLKGILGIRLAHHVESLRTVGPVGQYLFVASPKG
jgi:hypothetical protein